MADIKYKRVLLKLSGEALAAEGGGEKNPAADGLRKTGQGVTAAELGGGSGKKRLHRLPELGQTVPDGLGLKAGENPLPAARRIGIGLVHRPGKSGSESLRGAGEFLGQCGAGRKTAGRKTKHGASPFKSLYRRYRAWTRTDGESWEPRANLPELAAREVSERSPAFHERARQPDAGGCVPTASGRQDMQSRRCTG